MVELGPASSDEMVLAFVQAEIDTDQYGPHYLAMLKLLRFERVRLIDGADLSDSQANIARAIMLGATRGYGRNDGLFHGFPSDTMWQRVSLDRSDFDRMSYIGNDEFWNTLTAGTRAVRDGAAAYRCSRIEAPVDAIVQKIRQGVPMPDLILVDDMRGGCVILEGHKRATAYAVVGANSIPALIGRSPLINQWAFL
jgi:hypothetical protein